MNRDRDYEKRARAIYGDLPLKRWAVVVGVVVALTVAIKAVFAIEAPTEFRILNSYAYHNAFEDGDMLFLTKFTLSFDSTPSQSLGSAYVARLLSSGDEELATTAPASTVNTDGEGTILGYGDAVASFYLSADEVTALGMTWADADNRVIIQGSPSVYTGSLPTASSTSISYRDDTQTQALLEQDILTITQELDEVWLIDLIDRTSASSDLLNATAVDYWLRVQGDLNLMAPNIFPSIQLGLDSESLGTGTSYVAELKTVLDGTPLDTGVVSLANFLSIPKVLVTTALLIAIMGAVALYATKITGSGDFGLLTVAITLPLGALAGLTSLTFAAIVAFFCVLGMGYLFFYKPSSS